MDVPEADVGIGVYYTSTLGIGGRMRSEPEDFIVQEAPLLPERKEGGRYVIARVTARNWETNMLVEVLAKRLGVHRGSVSFAGTKDKRAISVQCMSFELKDRALEDVDLPGVQIEPLFAAARRIEMGDLRGNRFEVVVRSLDCNAEAAGERARGVWTSLGQLHGFPNFFGIQRFGVIRPVTHLVGRQIVKGDYMGAVMQYLGDPMPGEKPTILAAREYVDETQDFSGAVERYPLECWLERRLAEEMARGKRPEVALQRLPKNLLMMFVHAYQGYLFNLVLTRRIEAGLPILAPLVGDVVLPLDKVGLPDQGAGFVVRERNLDKVTRQAEAGKCFVSGLVFGTDSELTHNEMGEMEREVIEGEGLEAREFFIPCIPRISSKGTRRTLVARVTGFGMEMGPNPCFRFELQRGCYATCLMREFMKTKKTDY